MTDLADITYVHRVRIGGAGAGPSAPDGDGDAAAALLNRCLAERPRGRILAVEKEVATETIGGEQLTRQLIVYHVGFQRRPAWLG